MINTTELYLAPIPKKMSRRDGVLDPSEKRFIQLITDEPQCLIAAARQTGLDWEITASAKAPKEQVGLKITLNQSADMPADGYKLTIKPNIIEITSSTPAGAFYGACTLKQIVRQCGDQLPYVAITDAPDFPERGVMLDISRDKVPTMETLYQLVDMLAEWKINQFQLYTEHTFKYLAHPVVWEHASPMTGEQILELDADCRERFIELVPNQNSFGHMERWLKHDQYTPMAESPKGGQSSWEVRMDPFSLCPGDKRTLPFIAVLYDELLPHFTSCNFNVGCDETADLGYGRSKTVCKKRGTGRVYLDFLMEIYRLVTERGRTMQFWGDIIIHYPELIDELPKDAIALEWGYEADHPFDKHGAMFAKSGVPFYVCPGTSAWNSLSGRTENAIANISSAATNGLKHGAIGLLNTSWGDVGHWNPNLVEYLGFMAGAMLSWNAKSDIRKSLAECLSVHVFGDATHKTGRAFYDLGNVYQSFKKHTFNCAAPWLMLFGDAKDQKIIENIDPSEFDILERKMDEIEANLSGENVTCPDAEIVRKELAFLFNILRLSSKVGRVRLGAEKSGDLKSDIKRIKNEHRAVWLLRNRPGGLDDSVGKIMAAK